MGIILVASGVKSVKEVFLEASPMTAMLTFVFIPLASEQMFLMVKVI